MATQKVYQSTEVSDSVKPIVNKQELDNVDPADPRHFRKVKHLDGYESNAMSYNTRIQLVELIDFKIFTFF